MTNIDRILTDPSASDWLKKALTSALDRDPVDVTNDMEALSTALAEWVDPMFTMAPLDMDAMHMAAHAINHDRNCQPLFHTCPECGFKEIPKGFLHCDSCGWEEI